MQRDNLLVRIHCIIVMIRWTGLAPWEFEFPFPGAVHEHVQARPERPPGEWRGACDNRRSDERDRTEAKGFSGLHAQIQNPLP